MRTPLTSSRLAAAAAVLFLTACPAEDEVPAHGGAAGLAIVSGDHMASAISLLAPGQAMVAAGSCLDSGSKPPALSATLSGDVVLPSQPQPRHELLVIDRKNGALTWMDPTNCTVLRQFSVGAWSSPQDVVGLDTKAYVTRYNTNPGNAAEGSDVLVIDPKTGATLKTIDLRPWATAPIEAGKTILPYPTRAVLLGGKIFVALNELSAAFDGSGPGRVIAIDTATDTVTAAIDLSTLGNCGGIEVAPGDKPAIIVACGGPFGDPKQIDRAGIAWIDDPAGAPVVTLVTSQAFGRPVSGFEVHALSRTQAFTVVAGEFMGAATDALWSFSFEAGAVPTKVFEAGESFVMSAHLDRDGKVLYVMDATKTDPKVRVFSLAGATPTKTMDIVASPASGLPPQQMAWY
jgi:DNA-binding beta-propeller fold protein YncE